MLIVDSPGNTIGGTQSGDVNVISGNGGNGLDIIGQPSTGNIVEGNMIGTDVTGEHPQGNALDGIVLAAAPLTTIGGTAATAQT